MHANLLNVFILCAEGLAFCTRLCIKAYGTGQYKGNVSNDVWGHKICAFPRLRCRCHSMSFLCAFRNTFFNKNDIVMVLWYIYNLSINVFISLRWLLTNYFTQRCVLFN